MTPFGFVAKTLIKYAYQIVVHYPHFGVTDTDFNSYNSAIVVGAYSSS